MNTNPSLMDLYRQNTANPTLLQSEPAITVGAAMTAFLQALFMVLRAFNVAATAEMEQSAIALVTALLMFPAIAGIVIRFFAFSQNSAAQIAQGTYQGGK